jgi:hypothetical protein
VFIPFDIGGPKTFLEAKMKTPCEIIMLAAEGRAETTAKTLATLSADCGARKTLHWVGESAPPPHMGWDLAYWPGKPSGQTADMWRALIVTVQESPNSDIVYIEDDVVGCKNALAKTVQWNSPYLTTFINTRRFRPGVRLVDDHGFWPQQCIKIPCHVAKRLVAENPLAPKWQIIKRPGWVITNREPRVETGDIIIGRMLRAWGLKYYQHQSLFQHVGEKSLCNPQATLSPLRIAHDFPGIDFDALTL